MKSVLISTQPKWVAKICNEIYKRADGTPVYEKEIEVRKTRPKQEVPFRCLIYCTKAKEDKYILERLEDGVFTRLDGKVIGEFICDKIDEFQGEFWNNETHERINKVIRKKDWDGYDEIEMQYVAEDGEGNYLCENSCLTWEDLRKYIGQGINSFYGWHISNLVIYDKPKELGEFYHSCKQPKGTDCSKCIDDNKRNCCSITRPPQSWCYVEEV